MGSLQPYLSGPHILSDALIEKARSLPPGAETLVGLDQEVRPDTVVAHLNPGGYLHFVNVAQDLDIPFHLAAGSVVKEEGDTVRRGEVLAARPAALGLLLAECRSPSDGTIEKIYPSGHVTVRSYPIPVLAFISGRVTGIVPGTQLSILTSGTLVQGVFGLGGEKHGPLHVLRPGDGPADNRPEGDPAGDRPEGGPPGAPPGRHPDRLPPGAIVVRPGRAGHDLIQACLKAGVAALVASSCHWADLRVLQASKAPLTLVLIDGFGEAGATRGIFETLAGLHGREASVNGFTQLRAGVERPELIVPHGGAAGDPRALAGNPRALTGNPRALAGDPRALTGKRPVAGTVPVRVGRRTTIYVDHNYRLPRLELGARVRLVRAPYFGHEGEILDLPPEAQRIATGAIMPVAVVGLDDGRRVTVLRCNLVTTDEAAPTGLPATAELGGARR